MLHVSYANQQLTQAQRDTQLKSVTPTHLHTYTLTHYVTRYALIHTHNATQSRLNLGANLTSIVAILINSEAYK